MKTRIILFLFCLCTLSAAGQGITRQKCATCGKLKVQCPYKGNHPKPQPEKTCASCGKVISKCQYKGNHPKPQPTEKTCASCGKVISKCQYKGKHPSKPSINATNNTTNNATSNALSGYENGHEWVDLGLSVKWATTNVGASSPTDYGGYYAWGETRTKSDYSWSTYFDSVNGSSSNFNKYATNKKTTLDLSDDAAHANWGGSWRMPTRAEQDELREKCTWTWTTQNGVEGYKVSSKRNGNSIFLPAAGSRDDSFLSYAGRFGEYWSSSLDSGHSSFACNLYFHSSKVDWGEVLRFYGRSVRAVCP